MVGVRLYPHTAAFLLRENATRLNDSVLDLSALWGDAIKRMHERMAESETLGTRIALIEDLLSGFLREEQSLKFKYLEFAVRHFNQSHGRETSPQIAQKLGITPRYLEKLFVDYIGIPPKLFAQIVQLRQSVRLMNLHKTRTLTEVSYASGYYDQSHYIRAVRRFTGLTPSRLSQQRIVMQQPFLYSSHD
jgi:AraC-like DNA-binding protein